MFGRDCSLCGGKLDSRNICKECGLDNNKSEKNYKINVNTCDDQPMTHVHEEDWGRYRTEGTKPRKKKGCGCLAIFFVFIITVGAMALTGYVISEITQETVSWTEDTDQEYQYEEINPYAHVEEELPATGEALDYELTSGQYIVGVHIPSGNYRAEVRDDYDVIMVDDMENGFYLYEYAGKSEKNYLDDLRLYPGARVEIEAVESMMLTTENGQRTYMTWMMNPLTQSYEIVDSDIKTAGEDFAAGIYDIQVQKGAGEIRFTLFPDDETYVQERSFWLGEGSEMGTGYRYMVLPKGTEVICEEGMKVTLTPSERIESMDYEEFYYYY